MEYRVSFIDGVAECNNTQPPQTNDNGSSDEWAIVIIIILQRPIEGAIVKGRLLRAVVYTIYSATIPHVR